MSIRFMTVAEFQTYPELFGFRFPIRCPFATYRNEHLVPCGKCYFCMKKKAREWAFRVEAEAECSSNVYNLLLTYDDEHLPIDKKGRPILVKAHLSEMLKRFRDRLFRKFGARIRFFACGEYGGNFHRPHYHMILFSDTPLHGRGKGRVRFKKVLQELAESWYYGFVNISEYRGSVGAMTRYMTQYMFIEDRKTQYKPFRHMSRMPAIGASWLERNKEYVSRAKKTGDTTILRNGYRVQLPKYYVDKILSAEMKARRLSDYDQKCENFNYLKISLNYGRKKNEREVRQEVQQKTISLQRYEYRKRKVHHVNQHASGLFEKSAEGRKRRVYQKS